MSFEPQAGVFAQYQSLTYSNKRNMGHNVMLGSASSDTSPNHHHQTQTTYFS
jgi:hypothetical protein